MQRGLGRCHSPEPLLSWQAGSVRGSYQSWALGRAQPECRAAQMGWRARGGHRSQPGWLWPMEVSLFPQSCASPGADRALHPHKAQGRLKPSKFLPRNKLSSAQRLSPGLDTAPLPAGRASRTEINSRREKNISPEVDTVLFTESFCSATKQIDPAPSLRHKLPLMKLLALLKWETHSTHEPGLVTILVHWPQQKQVQVSYHLNETAEVLHKHLTFFKRKRRATIMTKKAN